MKRTVIWLLILISVKYSIMGQSEIDTLFYDKEWKGVENKAFATYFRVLSNSNDSNFKKRFRDYYITGELKSEGNYIHIDKYDDSKSIYDGVCMTYYSSGGIEQKFNFSKGKKEGEYVKYKEDGLILIHAYFKNDKPHGIYTLFSEDGKSSMQVEYNNGTPLFDYYVISNQNGYCSKIRISDNKPIYESPSLNEKKIEYINGEAWPYYNKNGIMIGMTNNVVRDYGKYFQIPIIISNNSIYPIDFDPDNITVSLVNKKGKEDVLKVLSAAEYMKKVRRSQNWEMALNAFSQGFAASGAGYSSSTTNSSYSGYSSSYGNASAIGSDGYALGSYYGNSSYSGSYNSSTTTYNGLAAYQAQIIASNRIADYNNALLSERAAKNEGYLKKSTIHPGETISGYINIERKKGVSMIINININGAIYTFPWDISK